MRNSVVHQLDSTCRSGLVLGRVTKSLYCTAWPKKSGGGGNGAVTLASPNFGDETTDQDNGI